MDYPKLDTLNSNSCREKIIEMHYPIFYKYVIETYPKVEKFTEKLYWFYHNIKEHPKCKCGKSVKFRNLHFGYYESCSKNCPSMKQEMNSRRARTNMEKYGVENTMQSKELKEKQKSTIKERYGVDNVFQLDECKEKSRETNLKKRGVEYAMQSKECIEKMKHTNREKYGVDFVQQNEGVHNKTKQSLINKYGVDHNFKAKEVCDKIKKTTIEKYGVENASQSRIIKEKVKATNIERYGVEYSSQRHLKEKYPDILEICDNYYICACPHIGCNGCKEKRYKIDSGVFLNRVYHNSETCTILSPIDTNHYKNTKLELFVQDILNNHNIEYETNNRKILQGQELDIYIPSKKLAIECNGCYWHSDMVKNKKYHINKYNKCKEREIQLLSIWEDWIVNKPNIVEDLILSKIGVYKHRIGARECTILPVSVSDAMNFANQNHIQGFSQAPIKIGLYYKGELVSLMTFGKKRKITSAKEDVWELIRFCTKLGWQVVGGGERLLQWFIKNFSPKNLISFSSNDISNGEFYKKLGFKYISNSESYWYIDSSNMCRYHRYNFTKHKLVKDGWSEELSEFEIMSQKGFIRIYDSGQSKWMLENL